MEDVVHDRIKIDNSPEASSKMPLGKSWKLLASVNLFILSLKSKWRRRRKTKLAPSTQNERVETTQSLLVNNWTGSQNVPPIVTFGDGLALGLQNGHAPHDRIQNHNGGSNFLTVESCQNSFDTRKKVSRTASSGTTGSIGSIGRLSSRLSVALSNLSARRVSVKVMWHTLTKGRSETPERRFSGATVDAKEVILPTSVTRQLAFGPWESGASRSRVHGYLMKVPLAKLVTLIIFFICVIVVTVIYVKKAEVEQKLRKKYGWS